MNDYFGELIKSMNWISSQENVKFLGQSVVWDGHALFKTMLDVPLEMRLETPVFEDFQMGISIGLALKGFIPVNIYPRMDFLIIATNQLINHLVNIRIVSDGKYKPRVITRVCVGTIHPLHPGPQHCQDHTDALKLLCRDEIDVVKLTTKEMILDEYKKAYLRTDFKPTILVEYADLYHKE